MKRSMAWSRGRIDAAGGAACAAMIACAYLLGFGPILRDRAAAAEERSTLSEQERLASAARSDLEAVDRQLKAAQAALVATPVRLLHASRANERIDELVRLARECELRVSATSPQSPRPERGFVTVPIKFAGSCTYTRAARFLAALHTNFPDIAVKGLSLSSTVGPEGPVLEEGTREATADFVFELAWHTASAGPGGGSASNGSAGAPHD